MFSVLSVNCAQSPWSSVQYRSMRTNLVDRMDEEDVRAKCVALHMISASTSESIAKEMVVQRRKEMLLGSISTVAEKFGMFREILRADSADAYTDYMEDLDGVAPYPDGESIIIPDNIDMQHYVRALHAIHMKY